MDDLNYLFHRQQEERARADRSACAEARLAHEELAFFYEEQIRRRTEGRIHIRTSDARMFFLIPMPID